MRSGFQVKLSFFTWKSDLSACFVVIVKGWLGTREVVHE